MHHVLKREVEARFCFQGAASFRGALFNQSFESLIQALKFLVRSFDNALAVACKVANLDIKFVGPGREATIRDRTNQAHSKNGHRSACDRDCERSRRERMNSDCPYWVVNDLDPTHRGEMMCDNGERQENGGAECPAHVHAAYCNGECPHSE